MSTIVPENDRNRAENHDSGSLANAPETFLGDVLAYFADQPGVAVYEDVLLHVTNGYLATLDPSAPPEPKIVRRQLLAACNAVLADENAKLGKSNGGRLPTMLRSLTLWQTAQVLLRLHHVIRVGPSASSKTEYDLLCVYVADGPARGTYTDSSVFIRNAARRYNTGISLKDAAEIEAILLEYAPRVPITRHPDLIAANNGVVFYGTEDADLEIGGRTFSFRAKSLHPFDPALVFTTKSSVDYVEDAPMPVISHPTDGDWDLESWMRSLSDDEGVPELLWEILGAIIRPNVSWRKTAWFYSERGNNGKGTFCALARNLVGDAAHTSIPLTDFGKDFALEPLISSSAIIVDENDVGSFIDQAANLKAVVTGDVIQINRKHLRPVSFRFHGFTIQCLNEFPRAKDKSDSFYRRQLFVPFTKWFGGNDGKNERRYIKDDYLQRQDVLEYALWYVVNRAGTTTPGSYYELAEPLATRLVLAEYKQENDPVRFFWAEFREHFVWDLLPMPFLYALFKAWFPTVSPSGTTIGQQRFAKDLRAAVHDDPDWEAAKATATVRPAQRMDAGEPLIAQYDLTDWKNPNYKGSDHAQIGRPVLKKVYDGPLLRV